MLSPCVTLVQAPDHVVEHYRLHANDESEGPWRSVLQGLREEALEREYNALAMYTVPVE